MLNLKKIQATTFAAAEALAEKIDGLMIQITQKTGSEGKLFGSVTSANIAEALEDTGFFN